MRQDDLAQHHQYTSGDLVIDGRSTKDFKDKDWDNYRNHSIGFVFQSYNLIPHQNVLSNVELALTLSGVSREERRRRAIEALEKVGLKDQIYKKPNQMSGGQMQRVAIARALIAKPDVIFADEPTGNLDSKSGGEVMELLQNVWKKMGKALVVITHDSRIARMADRQFQIVDGVLTEVTAK